VWKEVTKSIRECLQKTAAGFNRFQEVEDNVELANAFMDMFADAHLRAKIRNLAKQRGASNNVFRLWELAQKVIYDTGVVESNMNKGHEVSLNTLCERSAKSREGRKEGAAKVSSSRTAESLNGAKETAKKCWACGTSEMGHDWRACAKRTDLTESQKAAGAAAKLAAPPKKPGQN